MTGDAPAPHRPPVLVDQTLLFSDIEGSTERWEADAGEMSVLLAHHDRVTRTIVAELGGAVVKLTGDGVFATFDDPTDGVAAAIALQRAFAESTSGLPPLRVRIGLYRGVVELRDGDVFGPAVNRAARIMAAAHGEQILVGESIAAAVAGSVELVELGTHRLKGLRQPERLHQVLADGLRREFPTVRSLNADLGWLPATTQTLVNRLAELAEVPPLLEPGAVVSFVGPAGVGKTKLALHIAHDLRQELPDGAWFVDLATIAENGRVAATIAATVHLARDATTATTDALRELCQSQRMLLLVDNCEHVIDEVAETIRSIRGDHCRTSFLCTTQRRLGLAGERVVHVEPLTIGEPEAGDGLPASVELFVDRVRDVDRSFVLTPSIAPTVERICRDLDGLPLAIELAASRCRHLALDEVADRLDARFELLRSRGGDERHRTLANAIGWSVDLLDETDRRVLLSVAVFHGGFDRRGAAAVAALDELEALDSLHELTERSLVMAAAGRFRLLDSVRSFATAQLAASDRAEATRARHADWMISSLPVPLDGHDAVEVGARLDRVVADMPDLRAARTNLLARDPDRAARLTLDLVDLWATRSQGDEALEWIECCLAAEISLPLRIDLLGWASGFAWMVGDNEASERYATSALERAQDGDFPAYAAARLAVRMAFDGRVETACELAEQAETSLADDTDLAARLDGVLAVVHGVAGDVDRAVALADRGVELARRHGVIRTTTALANRLIIDQGGPGTPEMAHEVVEISQVIRRASGTAHAKLALALHADARSDHDAALRHLVEACDVLADTRQRTSLANVLEFAPRLVRHVSPRHAAILLGALPGVAGEVQQAGTGATRRERDTVARQLATALGTGPFDEAAAEGVALTLDEVLDFLHWAADDHLARIGRGGADSV